MTHEDEMYKPKHSAVTHGLVVLGLTVASWVVVLALAGLIVWVAVTW